MNGAEGLIKTLLANGIDTCFANPGTSEMQLVAAIDREPGMRAILGLFEGVVTGAADGYGRMAEKPAITLLHLGPGLGNGLANLHNAKRARTAVINIVGDHATDHLQYDAPLTSDVAGVAAPMSDWVRISESAGDLAIAGSEACQVALTSPGKVVTLIAPADHAWTEGGQALPANVGNEAPPVAQGIDAAAAAISKAKNPALFLGADALRGDALNDAGRIASVTGARLITETFCARLERGVGRVPTERLPYFGEAAAEFLQDIDVLVCIGAPPPVSFFAYPGKPSWLAPADGQVVKLADARDDVPLCLSQLAEALHAPATPATLQAARTFDIEEGPLDAKSLGFVLANHLPENAIVSDEAATTGLAIYNITAGSPHHDWLMLTGGSIGQGLPVAVGAAVACPDRKVIALQADGGAMYTVQALWTMVREQLDITTIIINNGSYAILNIELARVGASNPGEKALSLLDLTNPAIDWCAIAAGMGMQAERASTVMELDQALHRALTTKGPRLIEAVVPAAHLKA